jgi:hypothetical protein
MTPHYVTFEQAKKLKEKGPKFKSQYNQWLLAEDKGDDSKKFICHSDDLSNYTYVDDETEHNVYHCLSIPEHWQIVEWLRVNHGIWVYVRNFETVDFCSYILQKGESLIAFNNENKGYETPQEAYSAAFDYILNNLI